MKIVYVYKALALWGGIERILVDKMNYLSEQYNYDIYIITTCQGMHPIPYKLAANVVHIDLGIRFHTKYQYSYPQRLWISHKMNQAFKKKLDQQINNIKPDIIVTVADMFVNVITSLFPHIPIIAESHSMKSHTAIVENHRNNIIRNYIRNKYLQSINKVTTLVTLTQGDATEWKIPEITEIIPNCIHYNEQYLSSCENKKVILVGRFAYQKGIDYAIKAWKIVHKKHPDWSLHIYGEGELKNKYLEIIKEEGLTNSIIPHEPIGNIFEAYAENSMLLLTSRYEPFGLVIGEAMTCGIPCVSFDCPYGPRSIITDKVDGLLAQNGNVTDLSNKINYLIEHEDIRKEMGKKAKENIQRFYPDRIMPMWKQLFENVIKQKS